ncbi:MAG: HAD family phosphatase [Cyanobacteria bacterium P01_F01_bin.42]
MSFSESGSLQALIFDMDGVISDTMPYHLEAWIQYSQTVPALKNIDRDRLNKMGGKRNSELIAELLDNSMDEADAFCWAMEKEALYREIIAGKVEFLPGLTEFLERAEFQGLRLGLGTSACEENVDLILGHEDIGLRFPVRVTEADVIEGKPDPECYLLVAERLGVSPSDCLVFEDAIAGVQSAKRAGMRCWGVTTTEPGAALLDAGAELTIQDFGDPRLEELLAGEL